MDITRDSVTDVVTFRHVFTFKNGPEKEFKIRLDKKTLRLIQPEDRAAFSVGSIKKL